MHKGEIQVRITSYEKICCDFFGGSLAWGQESVAAKHTHTCSGGLWLWWEG